MGEHAEMNWLTKFLLACFGTTFGIVAVVWAALGSGMSELSTNGVIALILGIVCSTAVAVGLMALVFYSNRSGRDETMPRPDDSEPD